MNSLKHADTKRLAAFRVEVARWANRIRVAPQQVRVQRMKRKWGSCTMNGTVTFSQELIRQPQSFREYAIVHELLHLKVPNHGKLFKSLMRAYLPDADKLAAMFANP